MSITLYKSGTKKTVRGVLCDFVQIRPEQLNTYLKMGWSLELPGHQLSLEDGKKCLDSAENNAASIDVPIKESESEKEEIEPSENENFTDAEQKTSDFLELTDLRQKAKDAGIRGYHLMRAETLKDRLGVT